MQKMLKRTYITEKEEKLKTTTRIARNCQNYMKDMLYECVLKEMRNLGKKLLSKNR